MCLGRSAGFDLIGPADFFLAQSHTELRLTDIQKKLLQYTFKKNKVGLRPHFKTFRVV